MMKEYTHRLPLSYILTGLIVIGFAILFGSMIGNEAIWISLTFSVLLIILSVTGIVFVYTTLINFPIKTLKISAKYIELPIANYKYRKVSFDGIYNVHMTSNDRGKHIEIYTKKGNVFLIHQKWMYEKDFIEVSNRLNEWKK